MAKWEAFEFGYMSRREKAKLVLLKFVCLAWTTACLLAMVFWEQKTSAQLTSAGASLAGAYLYLNLCNVKSDVMKLFEPPYPLKGNAIGILGAAFVVASIYFQWIGS